MIGITVDEAAEIGCQFGQNAILAGRRSGPAELRDCWTLWPEAPWPASTSRTGGDDEEDAFCRCPICGAADREVLTRCCDHLLTDWCFTFDCEPGWSRGYWASDEEGCVLVAFESELRRLGRALDECVWPKRRRREFLRHVPAHLSFLTEGAAATGYDHLLRERLAASPGYAGSDYVSTDNPMVSDAWLVHWAHNGPAAARAVDELFRGDLAWVRRAIAAATVILGIDEEQLGEAEHSSREKD